MKDLVFSLQSKPQRVLHVEFEKMKLKIPLEGKEKPKISSNNTDLQFLTNSWI